MELKIGLFNCSDSNYNSLHHFNVIDLIPINKIELFYFETFNFVKLEAVKGINKLIN